MIDAYKKIFFKPEKFYKSIKHWSYTDVLRFLFTISFIPYLLYYYISTGVEDGFTNWLFLSALILASITVFVGPFINSFITHIGVMLMGSKGYKKTFLATGNAMTISAPYFLVASLILLSIVQANLITGLIITILAFLITLAGAVHLIITEVIGLKVMHNLTTFKAILAALVIPLVIGFILIFLLVMIIVFVIVIGGFTL